MSDNCEKSLEPVAYTYVNRFGQEDLFCKDRAERLIEAAKEDDRHWEAYPLVRLSDVIDLIDAAMDDAQDERDLRSFRSLGKVRGKLAEFTQNGGIQ